MASASASASLEKRKREAACGTGFHVRLWCNRDPCGLICAAISWFLVLYAECTVVVRWSLHIQDVTRTLWER